MAFSFALSDETRQRLEWERREALRLYALPDRWLARELVRMARALRAQHPEFEPWDWVYDSTMFWHVVPEIAFRFGERRFLQHERSDPEIRGLSDSELRIRAGIYWKNCGMTLYHETTEKRMFFREVVHGSPIVYALDRLAVPDETDVIARHILEVARFRKVESTGIWTPTMLSA